MKKTEKKTLDLHEVSQGHTASRLTKSMFSLLYNIVIFRMFNVHVALLSDMKMAFLIVPFSLNLVQRNKNQCVGIFNSRKVVQLHGFIRGIDFGLSLLRK